MSAAEHEVRKARKKEQKAARESRLRGVEGRRYVSARQFSAEQHTSIKQSKWPPPTENAGVLPVGYDGGWIKIGWSWVVSKQHKWVPMMWPCCTAKREEQNRRERERASERKIRCNIVNGWCYGHSSLRCGDNK